MHKQSLSPRDDVFAIHDLLTPSECQRFIQSAEQQGFEAALVNTALGQIRVADVRNNDRLIVDDPDLAQEWWSRCGALFPPGFGRWTACGLNERFRFYRYHPGQKFAAHRDGSFQRNANEISWMTLMVYLNDGYEGGRRRFDVADLDQPLSVAPQAGMGLAFMHDRLHEGEAVSSGVKYVLRTDVMYRRD